MGCAAGGARVGAAHLRSATQRVNSVLRRKTFLSWGLTSSWAVDGPRVRSAPPSGGMKLPAPQVHAPRADGTDSAEGARTRGSGSWRASADAPAATGYGDTTEVANEHMRQLLCSLAEHTLAQSGETAGT